MLQQMKEFAQRPWPQIMAAGVLALVLVTAVFLAVWGQTDQDRFLPVIMNHTGLSTPPPITPTPCTFQFVEPPVAGQFSPQITGQTETIVSIVDLTTGETIGTDQVLAAPGYACPGLADFIAPYQLNQPLTAGHVVQAQSDDSASDTAVVMTGTPAARQAGESQRLSAPLVMTTTTPSATPPPATISLQPDCGTPPTDPGEVVIEVHFFNWPTGESLTLLWEGNPLLVWQAGQHGGTFVQTIFRVLPQTPATYTITAQAGGGASHSQTFTVPCAAPIDLVSGQIELVSTPPIVAYQPVQFAVPITNTGTNPVTDQFFVDIFLDPSQPVVLTSTIPITESDGYTAVAGMPAGGSRVITITAPMGFENEPAEHHVYSFVDSLDQIAESDETNNISELILMDVTPTMTPTPTDTPAPGHDIEGVVYTFGEAGFQTEFRALVQLVDEMTGVVVATTESGANGEYTFDDLPAPGRVYSVYACQIIDGQERFGYRTNVQAPQELVYLSLLPRPCASQPPPPPPTDPTIALLPDCGWPATNPGEITFNVIFAGWPVDQSLTLYWEGAPLSVWQAGQHAGTFIQSVTYTVPQTAATYQVTAEAGGGATDSQIFAVPCATLTPTPPPSSCDIQFEGIVFENDNFIDVTGGVDTIATIYNLSTDPNTPITSGPLLAQSGHACPGFASLPVDSALFSMGDVLYAVSNDLSTDTTIVQGTSPTPTPFANDLTIGQPALISTPPIVAYQPVEFSVPITNTGSDPVIDLFFVDIFLDPTVILTTSIPISQSGGYTAVSSLGMGESRVVTITAPLGFQNTPATHQVYGMVDSLAQIVESDETNNISPPLMVFDVTPAASPTPTIIPGGNNDISGGTFRLDGDLILQSRTQVVLIDDTSGSVIFVTESDDIGFYIFEDVPVPSSSYTVAGCINIDGQDWYGMLTGIVPPNTTAHIILLPVPCS